MAKIPQPRRALLQTRARQLLSEGHDEDNTIAVMVNEKLCSYPIARGIVQWVIAYNWTPSPRKR